MSAENSIMVMALRLAVQELEKIVADLEGPGAARNVSIGNSVVRVQRGTGHALKPKKAKKRAPAGERTNLVIGVLEKAGDWTDLAALGKAAFGDCANPAAGVRSWLKTADAERLIKRKTIEGLLHVRT